MKLDPNDPFRKLSVPWYQADVFHVLVCLIMAVLIIFSAVGLGMAWNYEQYGGYYWLPLALLILSGMMFATNFIRLLGRLFEKSSDLD